MKRITTWFLSTVTVVVLMFGYHTSTSGALGTASPPAVSSGGTGNGTTASGSGGSGSGSSGSGSSNASTKKSGGGQGSQSQNNQSAQPTTVTGSVAQTMWGPVQVQLTVSGGKVTYVSVLQYPSGNPQDDEINSYALPVLIQETMSAQSAHIDMVSGATVTSTGYLQSLQSALDQANL